MSALRIGLAWVLAVGLLELAVLQPLLLLDAHGRARTLQQASEVLAETPGAANSVARTVGASLVVVQAGPSAPEGVSAGAAAAWERLAAAPLSVPSEGLLLVPEGEHVWWLVLPPSELVAAIDVGRAVGWLALSALALGVGLLSSRASQARRYVPPRAGVKAPLPPPEVPAVAARQDRAWLEGLLEGMREGVLAFDAQGRVAFANGAAATLLSRKPILEGTPMVAFADVPRLRSTTVEALRGREAERELEVPGPPRRDLWVRARPVPGGAVVVLVDLSGARVIERAQRDFVHHLTHELRTPLAVLLHNAEALREPGLAEGVQDELLGGLTRNAGRLARLTAELTELAQRDAGELPLAREALGVAEVVGPLVSDVCLAKGAEGRVAVTVVAGLKVDADPVAFDEVIANLLSNALAYSEGRVWLRAWAEPGAVAICVEDEGPGVPLASREAIFGRFVKQQAGEGFGLGLAICRQWCDRHSARVWCEAAPGGGARFQVRWPPA